MFNWLKSAAPSTPVTPEPKRSMFSFSRDGGASKFTGRLVEAWNNYLEVHRPRAKLPDGTFDSCDMESDLKAAYNLGQPNVSEALFQWYGTQSFIGHQMCALVAQHWLIDKACTMPGLDAIRNGWEIVNAAGETAFDEKVIRLVEKYDKKFRIKIHLREFVRFGRVFGIRVVIPKIESADPAFYEKPFNIDGITRGSYQGLIQVDPYWMSPILDREASANPTDSHFYEPTWWLINGKKYHRSHLIIFKTNEPADILKPAYLYSGVPIPQKIMERVYGAERTANEAPLLTMTKRTTTFKVGDIEAAMANKQKFDETMGFFIETRDNYGVKIMGPDDEMQQFDTALSDLDAVIMSQYQLVAAAAEVPATKLLGTTPKGFNATGQYDESSYHEMLETIQEHDLTPLLNRHYALVMKSHIEPVMGILPAVEVSWNPLDAPTAKERADTNYVKAQTDSLLFDIGAVGATDINERLRHDEDSGYKTLTPLMDEPIEPPQDDEPQAD